MKLQEQCRALTKRDLLNKLQKVERALGAQAQRADAAERENSRLLAEIIRHRNGAPQLQTRENAAEDMDRH
ncbi:hypothetical protein [Devosia naphthalenivorans]|uniref:hypothetical protein n=1 Tax=Devosia naphthalenivorans TaxID=2082392 RepID=UPI000D3AEFCF|nr:hypothetical protein [Devosia naphthalenivorans]